MPKAIKDVHIHIVCILLLVILFFTAVAYTSNHICNRYNEALLDVLEEYEYIDEDDFVFDNEGNVITGGAVTLSPSQIIKFKNMIKNTISEVTSFLSDITIEDIDKALNHPEQIEKEISEKCNKYITRNPTTNQYELVKDNIKREITTKITELVNHLIDLSQKETVPLPVDILQKIKNSIDDNTSNDSFLTQTIQEIYNMTFNLGFNTINREFTKRINKLSIQQPITTTA